MRFGLKILLVTVFLVLAGNWVWAVDKLSESMVRLSRNKTGVSPLPVLIQFKTDSVTVEDGLKLRVGSGWEVGSVTISSDSLPDGVTAVSGLAVRSVSGQEIEFDSGNLVSGTSYGFYITGGIGVNPAVGQDMSYKWLMSTLSGVVTDREREMKVAVIADDQLVVTGRVGANATDFQLAIEASPSGTMKQNEEKAWTITYGSYLPSVVKPLKITASWSLGTVSGSPVPSVDLLTYVVGSATTAYGGVPAVIDTVNRTIEWTITSFPADTQDREVGFSLKTTDNYTGASQVTFTVGAEIEAANVVTISDTYNGTYQYYSTITPTPTSAPSSSSGSSTSTTTSTTSSTTTTTTTTATEAKLRITDVAVMSVGNQSAGIKVTANLPLTSIKLRYGRSLGGLYESITSLVTGDIRSKIVDLEGLTSDTDYYFQTEVVSQSGQRVISDYFTFRTSKTGVGASVDKKSFLIISGNTVIFDARTERIDQYLAVIPENEIYSVKVNLEKSDTVSEVRMIINPLQVLGIMSVAAVEPSWASVEMLPVDDIGFVGQLIAPRGVGFYEITLRVTDIYGNISLTKLGNLRVIKPFLVYDEEGEAMEGARVKLYQYNRIKRIYEELSYLSVESDGKLRVLLGKGQYRAEINNWRYQTKSIDFTIGAGEDEIMPRVILERKSMALADWWGMLTESGQKMFGYFGGVAGDVGSSKRVMQMLGVIQLTLLVLIMLIFWIFKERRGWHFWVKWPLTFKIILRETWEMVTSIFLVGMVVASLFFTKFFRWSEVWPYLSISILNISIWFILVLLIERSGEEKN